MIIVFILQSNNMETIKTPVWSIMNEYSDKLKILFIFVALLKPFRESH